MLHLQSFFFFLNLKRCCYITLEKGCMLLHTKMLRTCWYLRGEHNEILLHLIQFSKHLAFWSGPTLSQGNLSQSFMPSLYKHCFLKELIHVLPFSDCLVGCYGNCRKWENAWSCSFLPGLFLHLTDRTFLMSFSVLSHFHTPSLVMLCI